MTKTFARPTPKTAAAFAEDFEKALGENDESATVTHFIDTGFPPLNMIMSGRYDGGLPQGRLVEIFGGSSTGKTALATEYMAMAQKMGGCAGFEDWERSFSQIVAQEGYKLDLAAPYWSYKKPRTWEEGNMQAAAYARWVRDKGVIHEDAPILIVLDSIASAVPRSAADKNIDEFTMNDTTALARAAGPTLRNMAMEAERYNATFLYLNQTRTKPGVIYGDPTTTPGGVSMEFFATVRLSLTREKIMQQVDGEKEFVGQNIGIKCVKSKMTKPLSVTKLRLNFDDSGIAFFDKEYSMVESLLDLGKLEEPRKGFVLWDGKQIAKKALAEKVRTEGATEQLVKLFA